MIINGYVELYVAIAKALVSYETFNDEERAQVDQMKTIWKINGDSYRPRMPEILQWFYPNHLEDPTYFDSCYPSMGRLAVYQTALRGDHQALGGLLLHLSDYSDDVQVAALECVSDAWKRVEKFSGLCEALNTQMKSESSAVRTLAFNNVSNYLDHSFSRTSQRERQESVKTLLAMAPHNSGSLSIKQALVDQAFLGEQELCAKIRFGAWLSVAAYHSSSDLEMDALKRETFKLWSHWLTWGSASTNVSLDFRYPLVSLNIANLCSLTNYGLQ
jgi:hypothetical protein